MRHENFKATISGARKAFGAGKVPAESDFNNLIDAVEDAGFARGMIMMFAGRERDVPSGWALCEGGEEGVPDLRGRFIVGDSIDEARSRHGNNPKSAVFNFEAGTFPMKPGTFNVTIRGNSENTVLTETHLPKHDHVEAISWMPYSYKKAQYDSFSEYKHIVGNNRLDTKRVAHGESLAYLGIVPYNPAPMIDGGMYSESYKMHTTMTGADTASHRHAIDGKFDVEFTLSNGMASTPPYYALAFIMKL